MCGFRNIRIWFGPLPVSICFIHYQLNKLLMWFGLLTILSISLTKFMLICVWKSMRGMNDNLLARISFNISLFLSLFFQLTVLNPAPTRNQAICTGIFDDIDIIGIRFNGIHPYTVMYLTFSCITLTLCIAVKIGKHLITLDEPVGLIPKPKNLESMLLNLSLVMLIFISYFLRRYTDR